jgi:hypothetical protein
MCKGRHLTSGRVDGSKIYRYECGGGLSPAIAEDVSHGDDNHRMTKGLPSAGMGAVLRW